MGGTGRVDRTDSGRVIRMKGVRQMKRQRHIGRSIELHVKRLGQKVERLERSVERIEQVLDADRDVLIRARNVIEMAMARDTGLTSNLRELSRSLDERLGLISAEIHEGSRKDRRAAFWAWAALGVWGVVLPVMEAVLR